MIEDDFSRKFVGDVLIERVNFIRATIKEAAIFRDRLYDSIAMKQYKIVVDLRKCEFIDSTFLGAIVMVLKKITEKGGELKIIAPSAEAFEIMNTMGLYRVFNIYSSEEQALESFSS